MKAKIMLTFFRRYKTFFPSPQTRRQNKLKRLILAKKLVYSNICMNVEKTAQQSGALLGASLGLP
jgi:hypothetical protein